MKFYTWVVALGLVVGVPSWTLAQKAPIKPKAAATPPAARPAVNVYLQTLHYDPTRGWLGANGAVLPHQPPAPPKAGTGFCDQTYCYSQQGTGGGWQAVRVLNNVPTFTYTPVSGWLRPDGMPMAKANQPPAPPTNSESGWCDEQFCYTHKGSTWQAIRAPKPSGSGAQSPSFCAAGGASCFQWSGQSWQPMNMP